MLLTKSMFLTKAKDHLAAQREASQTVARGKSYSVDLPIIGRVPVPPPEQLAIYAALGGLAALELLDWPVALAMGVGSALVARHLSELETRGDELAEAMEPATEDTPGPTTARKEPARTQPARTQPVKKAPARTAPARKAPTTSAAPKATAKKATAKKAAAKKAPAKKPAAKKAATGKAADSE